MCKWIRLVSCSGVTPDPVLATSSPHPAPGGFGFKQALLRTKHQIRGPEKGVKEEL